MGVSAPRYHLTAENLLQVLVPTMHASLVKRLLFFEKNALIFAQLQKL